MSTLRELKDQNYRITLHCAAMVAMCSHSRHSVIAFSRTGDPDTGDFDDPVILAKFGDVPDLV